jgi:hypothetical protein
MKCECKEDSGERNVVRQCEESREKDEKKHSAFMAKGRNVAPMEILRHDLVAIKTASRIVCFQY